MSKIKTFLNLVKNDRRSLGIAIMANFARMPISHLLSDKAYLKLKYLLDLGKKLDLKNPQRFNEKMQWLKLYDRNPEYTIMVDKQDVKEYVTKKSNGEVAVIPTIGVWDSADEIDFNSLPSQFVMKCTHDSGSTVVCKNKAAFDFERVKKRMNRRLKKNMFWWGREWPYKNVKPRILIEEYVQDGVSPVLPVYKFFCFDGQPKIIQTIQNDKKPNETIDYFNTEWNLLELRQNFPNSEVPYDKPTTLDEMLEAARKLSADKLGFIRVDLYCINGKIYFSEYTFFSDCGAAAFTPDEWDLKLGEMVTLPIK